MTKLQEYKGNYFKHPYRPLVENLGLEKVDLKYSDEGYGLYWKILELLWINEGIMIYDINVILKKINKIHKKSKIIDIIENFDLFELVVINGITFIRDLEIINWIDERVIYLGKKIKGGLESGKVRKEKKNNLSNTCELEEGKEL